MEDLEKIYDDEIHPLVTQIIEICQKHEMPMFASFEFNDGDFCTSRLPFDGHPVFSYYDALKQCAEDGGVNIDKLMFWIMKGARERGHSSLVLSQLDIPTAPDKDGE